MEDWKLDQRSVCTAWTGVGKGKGVETHMYQSKLLRPEDCTFLIPCTQTF